MSGRIHFLPNLRGVFHPKEPVLRRKKRLYLHLRNAVQQDVNRASPLTINSCLVRHHPQAKMSAVLAGGLSQRAELRRLQHIDSGKSRLGVDVT